MLVSSKYFTVKWEVGAQYPLHPAEFLATPLATDLPWSQGNEDDIPNTHLCCCPCTVCTATLRRGRSARPRTWSGTTPRSSPCRRTRSSGPRSWAGRTDTAPLPPASSSASSSLILPSSSFAALSSAPSSSAGLLLLLQNKDNLWISKNFKEICLLGLLSIGLLLTLLSTKGLFCYLPTYRQSFMVVDIKLYHKTSYFYTQNVFTWNKMIFIKWLLFWYICLVNGFIGTFVLYQCDNMFILQQEVRKYKSSGVSSLLCWYLNIDIEWNTHYVLMRASYI